MDLVEQVGPCPNEIINSHLEGRVEAAATTAGAGAGTNLRRGTRRLRFWLVQDGEYPLIELILLGLGHVLLFSCFFLLHFLILVAVF